MINTINMLDLCFMIYFIAFTFGSGVADNVNDQQMETKIKELNVLDLINCLSYNRYYTELAEYNDIYFKKPAVRNDKNYNFRNWQETDTAEAKKCLQNQLNFELWHYIKETKQNACIQSRLYLGIDYQDVQDLINCLLYHSYKKEKENHKKRVDYEIKQMYKQFYNAIENKLNVLDLKNCIYDNYYNVRKWQETDTAEAKKCLRTKLKYDLLYYVGETKLNTCLHNLQNSDIFGSLNKDLLNNMISTKDEMGQKDVVADVKFKFKSNEGTKDEMGQKDVDTEPSAKKIRVTMKSSVIFDDSYSKLKNLHIQKSVDGLDKNRGEDSELWEYTNFIELYECIVDNEIFKKYKEDEMNQLNMCIFTIKLKTCMKEGVNLKLTRDLDENSLSACMHDMHDFDLILETNNGYMNALTYHVLLHDLTSDEIHQLQADEEDKNVYKALIAYQSDYAKKHSENNMEGYGVEPKLFCFLYSTVH